MRLRVGCCSGGDPVNVDCQDIDSTNALMLAAKHGHCSIVEVLLEAASRRQQHNCLNACNKHKQTALHEAAKRGHVAIAAALIFAGATPSCADRWLNRPLQYAALHGHAAVVALLAGPHGGNNVDAVNLGRRTALHTAAQNGHDDIAGILLEAGAKTTVRDSDGDTPTLLAGRYQHRTVFELLVSQTLDRLLSH